MTSQSTEIRDILTASDNLTVKTMIRWSKISICYQLCQKIGNGQNIKQFYVYLRRGEGRHLSGVLGAIMRYGWHFGRLQHLDHFFIPKS
jgi:hypothetical protein